MTAISKIKNASSTSELIEIVEAKAAELGIELRDDLTWREDAMRVVLESEEIHLLSESVADELADVLEAAEDRWYEIEGKS